MTTLNDWSFEETLQVNLLYRPGEGNVNFLDIWQYEGVDSPWIEEGLGEKSLDEWLNLVPPSSSEGRTLVGGLRLIFYHVETSMYGDPTYVIPWERPVLDKILRVFKLPLRSALMLTRGRTSFESFSPKDPGVSHGRFAYIWSTPSVVLPYWSMAASYDPESNVTYAYLQHISEPVYGNGLGLIVPHLKRIASSLMHPLIIPTLIADLHVNIIACIFDNLQEDLRMIEAKFANNVSGKRDPIIVDSLQLDLPNLVGELLYYNVQFAYIWQRVENYALALPLLKKQTEMIGEYVAASHLHPHFEELSAQMERKFESVKIQNQSLTPAYHRVQTSLQMLLSVFKTDNHYMQRDNKLNQLIANASKRDSSAMKVLAVVTMTFLPGTFVASFFAIPMFNWDATEGERVVNNRFYIYWAVTIPLTIIVLVVWAIWVKVILRAYSREDAKIGIPNYKA